jgi:uncharacterized protein (TIGR03067 family)
MTRVNLRAATAILVGTITLVWVAMGASADKPTDKAEVSRSSKPISLRFGDRDKVIPIQRGSYSGWWYVKCKCDGKDAFFVLDTGVGTTSILQPQYAKKHGHPVKPTGEEGYSDAGGTKGKHYGQMTLELELPGLDKAKRPFFIQDSPTVAEGEKKDKVEPVYGLLGLDFLEYYGGVLDIRHEQLVLRDPLPLCEDLLGKKSDQIPGKQWLCVSTEVGGKATEQEVSEDHHLVLTPDVMVYKTGEALLAGHPTVNPDTNPKQLTFRTGGNPEHPYRFIYKLDGDTLVVAMNQTKQAPEWDKSRPTGFDTKKGEAAIVLRFKQKKEK